jgi:hypothetical protein
MSSYSLAYIHDVYSEMERQLQRSGREQRAILPNGCDLTLRQEFAEVVLVVRKRLPISAGDEINLRQQCQVPQRAWRSPDTGTTQRVDSSGVTWRYIEWRWTTNGGTT